MARFKKEKPSVNYIRQSILNQHKVGYVGKMLVSGYRHALIGYNPAESLDTE